MKKLFALLAVMLLSATYVYAVPTTDSWTGGPLTGTFTATVVCTPQLLPVDGTSKNLGYFFNDGNPNTISSTIAWTLQGPTTGNYTLTTHSITTVAGINLVGSWSGDWSGQKTGTQLGIDCNSQRTISYTVTSITVGTGVSPNWYTWTLTIQVDATI